MIFNQLSDKAKLRRHRTNEAIALAMQSRWEEAVAVNRSIIEISPDDADAYNRLGKACTQLGRYAEAREAYGHALGIDSNNGIARKNFERLSHLQEAELQPKGKKGVSSHIFIEETGKADVAELYELAPQAVLAKMAAGEPVTLAVQGQKLMVESADGEYIGEVEPRIGLRLVKLMEGGNEYSAAIARIGQDRARVMIRETYQHPSRAGRPSFPVRAADEFRSYVKDSMLKYELEDEEEDYDEDSSDEWSAEELPRKASNPAVEEVVTFADESLSENGGELEE